MFVLLSALAMISADPWHLPGWEARAVVAIGKPSREPGMDAAVVGVLLQGDAKPNGDDLRVVDASGKPVPFQVLHVAADRDALIAFRATDPAGRYFIYFKNPQAQVAPERIQVDPKPGAGPPKAAWTPRFGVAYQTLRRPEGPNPKTVEEMAGLLAASTESLGARVQPRVADGYNPFGPSDNYLSIYRGWIRIPKSGTYQFCTVSNEASFSFLDGKPLVAWPGRHTIERGARGEIHAAVELSVGLHYLEYYHEEVTLQQMAYLGWRLSADAGAFAPIPESVFPAPHAAQVSAYETPRGPLLRFAPKISGSIWPEGRSDGQYTLVKFSPDQSWPKSAGARLSWTFGDGATTAAENPDHIYLATGRYQVALAAGEGAARQTATWPLDVFEIEHVTDQFAQGKPREYAALAKGYDRATLDERNLRELVLMLSENGEPKTSLEAGRQFLARFPKAAAPRARRAMAEAGLSLGEPFFAEAIANFEASIGAESKPADALATYARLIRLVGVDRDMVERASEFADRADRFFRASRPDAEAFAAYRAVLIAAGDAKLWHDKPDDARKEYAKADSLSATKIPPQVRAARLGAYPNAVREFLAARDLDAASELLERIDDVFPMEKLGGQTLFWRGKVTLARKRYAESARFFSRAVALAPGSGFETEARYLWAGSLEAQEQPAEAREVLKKLVATGLDDTFTRKAREVLARPSK